MPSNTRTVGLIFVVAGLACLAVEPARCGEPPPDRPPAAPTGYSLPFGRSDESSLGVPLSPHSRQSPLPLPGPEDSNRTQKDPGPDLSSAITVAGSLALVLGLFLLVAWAMRRAAPAGSALLPGEVFEVLGRAPMAGRQQVHLLRCGNKLLLCCVTPAGAETLAEITDPLEVDRLAGLCRQTHPGSATAVFRQVFGQLTSGHARAGAFSTANRGGLEDRDV
jgi:flagellar biogenesis protein FliO